MQADISVDPIHEAVRAMAMVYGFNPDLVPAFDDMERMPDLRHAQRLALIRTHRAANDVLLGEMHLFHTVFQPGSGERPSDSLLRSAEPVDLGTRLNRRRFFNELYAAARFLIPDPLIDPRHLGMLSQTKRKRGSRSVKPLQKFFSGKNRYGKIYSTFWLNKTYFSTEYF